MVVPTKKRDKIPVCNRPGVYLITNVRNGKVYVGSAVAIRGRLLYHRSFLRRGKHDNSKLQRAWNKYGEEAFRFDVLRTCSVGTMVAREQTWIDRLKACDDRYGYNLCPVAGAGPMTGRRHTEESRRKMSRARKGMDTSKATAAAALVTRGKPRPPEVCEAIRQRNLGKKMSPESVAKIKANHWSTRPDAAEVAERVAAKNRGKVRSEEFKRRVSEVHKGRPKSEETRRRMTEAWVLRRAKMAAARAAERN